MSGARSRRRRWLPWAIPAGTTGLVAVMLSLSAATAAPYDVADVMFALAFVAYSVVGALIAARHPENPVGWLAASLGLVSALSETLYAFASRSGEAPGQPSGVATAAAWVTTSIGGPSFVLLVVLLLVFPDGRFLSRRWRAVAVTAGLLALVWSLTLALRPGPLADVTAIQNPVGLEGFRGVTGAVERLASSGLLLLLVVAASSVVLRFRSSNAVARQQIKWLAAAAGFAMLMVLAVVVLTVVADTSRGLGDLATGLLIWAALVAFPVGIGIAVLRHRLYDIDVVIKRTLVYVPLTAALLGAYILIVLSLQPVLRPVTGDSDLAVAASTLAAAALFRPLRARFQAVVDRRFYRSRYDATRTVQDFSGRLRDELDLESLTADLRRVAHDTMAPAHVTLWLRSPS